MRNACFYTAWFGALLLALSVKAQITLELKLETRRFVMDEPISATLRIQNNTGSLLRFGDGPEDATLQLIIERYKGRHLPARDKESPVAGLSLMQGETREIKFNLTRFIALPETGPYKGYVSVARHDEIFNSGLILFDIYKGVTLRKLTGVVSSEPGATRIYTLKSLQRDRSDCLYLSIGTRDDESFYGLFPLGTFTRNPEPDLRFDEAGNLHILFRAAGGSFVYTAFTPYGIRIAGEIYRLTPTSHIRLLSKPSGQVSVEAVDLRASPEQDSATPANLTP